MKYFHLRGQHRKDAGVFCVPKDFDEFAYWDEMETRKSLTDWVPIPFTVKSYDGGGKRLIDWPASDLVHRLCSSKLRQVIEPFTEKAVWLPVEVDLGGVFYILHFSEFPDLIDNTRSEFVGGTVFKPHLDRTKVRDRDVFALKPLSKSVIVSQQLKNAIIAARCIGIQFEHVPAT